MKYIFPRQFGLHNVFTSTVDPKETIQPFKDYALREQEIVECERRTMRKCPGAVNHSVSRQRLPKRLRNETFDLVKKLQSYHSRCSYHKILKYYCPLKVSYAASITLPK